MGPENSYYYLFRKQMEVFAPNAPFYYVETFKTIDGINVEDLIKALRICSTPGDKRCGKDCPYKGLKCDSLEKDAHIVLEFLMRHTNIYEYKARSERIRLCSTCHKDLPCPFPKTDGGLCQCWNVTKEAADAIARLLYKYQHRSDDMFDATRYALMNPMGKFRSAPSCEMLTGRTNGKTYFVSKLIEEDIKNLWTVHRS